MIFFSLVCVLHRLPGFVMGGLVIMVMVMTVDLVAAGSSVAEYSDAKSVEWAVMELKDSELQGRRILVRKVGQCVCMCVCMCVC